MEAAQQGEGTDLRLGAVGEPRTRSPNVTARSQRAQRSVPRERAERHHDADVHERRELTFEIWQAVVALGRRRAVSGRCASVDRGNIRRCQAKRVVAMA
jgi:hypothetical protein